MSDWHSTSSVSRILRVQEPTVRKWCSSSKLPFVEQRGQLRVPHTELLLFMDKHEELWRWNFPKKLSGARILLISEDENIHSQLEEKARQFPAISFLWEKKRKIAELSVRKQSVTHLILDLTQNWQANMMFLGNLKSSKWRRTPIHFIFDGRPGAFPRDTDPDSPGRFLFENRHRLSVGNERCLALERILQRSPAKWEKHNMHH